MSSQVDHGNEILNELGRICFPEYYRSLYIFTQFLFFILDDQVKVIGKVITEHEQLTEDLQVAKGSIGKLFRREITDKMLMYFVVGFFIFTCMYILKVRLRISFGWLWGIFGWIKLTASDLFIFLLILILITLIFVIALIFHIFVWGLSCFCWR